MPTPYAGDPSAIPAGRPAVTINVTLDADAPNAALFNDPYQKLADYVKALFDRAVLPDSSNVFTDPQEFQAGVDITGGSLDMHGFKITNLGGGGPSAGDAVNYGQLEVEAYARIGGDATEAIARDAAIATAIGAEETARDTAIASAVAAEATARTAADAAGNIKAHAKVTTDGASGITLQSGVNVAAVALSGLGDAYVKITFTTAFADVHYVVTPHANRVFAPMLFAQVITQATTYIEIGFYQTDGTPVPADTSAVELHVMCTGAQ